MNAATSEERIDPVDPRHATTKTDGPDRSAPSGTLLDELVEEGVVDLRARGVGGIWAALVRFEDGASAAAIGGELAEALERALAARRAFEEPVPPSSNLSRVVARAAADSARSGENLNEALQRVAGEERAC